jgi:hypothetical protein
LSSVNDTATQASQTAGQASTTAGNAVTIAQGKITIGNAAADVNNNFTKIEAGSLSIDAAADSINAGNTTISGSKITTGTLNANRIGSGTLPVSVIYAGDISADQVSAGTFTGSTFRTSTPNNKRILISGSSNTIKVYESGDSDSSERGTIEGTSTGLEMSGRSGAQFRIGTNTAEYYGGDSTRPNLVLGSTGLLMYGYHPNGSSDKAFIGLSSGQATFRGPGGTSSPAVYATTNNLQFTTGTSGYDFSSNYSVRIEHLGGSTTNVGVLSDGTLYKGASDRRLKSDIKDIDLGLDFTNSLRGVTFKWNTGRTSDTEVPNFGLIAQEVESALIASGVEDPTNLVYKYRNGTLFPDLDEEENIYGVEYTALIPVLLKSMQELSSKVTELETRLEALENK